MSKRKICLWAATLLAAMMAAHAVARAEESQVLVGKAGTNLVLQVRGDPKDEWRFQFSEDLLSWKDAPGLGAVYANTPLALSAGGDSTNSQSHFYRAVQTAGLYDIALLRTISLTFTQSNWQTLLTSGHNTGSNTVCTLALDNGITIEGVGARYRGNTSFGGMGGTSSLKKSLNLEIDFQNPDARLMGYKTLNLNNAFMDETLMREPLYFNAMRRYTICPHSSFVKLYINGAYWGVYCDTQQEDGDLIREYLPSNDGDRWRAPNMAGMGGGGRPGGGGTSGAGPSALSYLGTNIATYKANYELKSDNSTNAWEKLMHATDVLNNTPTNQLRDKVEDVLAVDNWLWFLAIENVFTDEDGYYSKGADYGFYYEPESGRIHPVEHDGNESSATGDISVSPVMGATSSDRPLLKRLLSIPELRQRYLAHMRTVLEQTLNPAVMAPLIQQYSALTKEAIAADPKKGFTMATYSNDVNGLLSFVTKRYQYLTNHAELRPAPPRIESVSIPAPAASEIPWITAEVLPEGTNGISSVWLYHRGKSFGRFTTVQMWDDGEHGDGLANDGVYGARTTNYSAVTKVRYYVEARSANSAMAAAFSPAQAEMVTYHYHVSLFAATNTPVVINEVMASNKKTLADPQGDYDDWVELRNLTSQEVDLSGRYLTDEPDNPRKWQLPGGTRIPANGYLLVWADDDQAASDGLHASFKLDAKGDQLLLIDTDANMNAVLDSISFETQFTDYSYGRLSGNPAGFGIMTPTPGKENR